MSELERVAAQISNELGVKPMGDTTGDSTHLNLLPALRRIAIAEILKRPSKIKATELFPHPDPAKNLSNCGDCLEIVQRFREALERDLLTS